MPKRDPDFICHTSYEWDAEPIDEHGDIEDHDWYDTLKDMNRIHPADSFNSRKGLVLIRDYGCQADGLEDRQWAYAERGDDGKLYLPERFDGGNKVPQKFHKEIARWQA